MKLFINRGNRLELVKFSNMQVYNDLRLSAIEFVLKLPNAAKKLEQAEIELRRRVLIHDTDVSIDELMETKNALATQESK